MLDPLLLKNDLDSLKDNLKRRNLDVDLEQLIELDESRRKLRFEAEKLRADQKSLGKGIANAEPKEKDVLLEKASQISENVKKLFDEVEEKDNDNANLKQEVLDIAAKYPMLGIKLLIIDTERKFIASGFGKELAEAAKGKYVQLPKATDKAIAAMALNAINEF